MFLLNRPQKRHRLILRSPRYSWIAALLRFKLSVANSVPYNLYGFVKFTFGISVLQRYQDTTFFILAKRATKRALTVNLGPVRLRNDELCYAMDYIALPNIMG